MSERILVVDDEELIRESLSFVLRKEGYEVEEAKNGADAFSRVTSNPFDIVITDIEMPEMRGTELLEKIAGFSPQTFVIIITAYGSIETAIEALRKGAYDYILKPLEFDEVLHRIRKLLQYRDLARENSFLRKEINRTYDFHKIIGHSTPMKRVFQVIEKVAESDGTVLITGRSGTGKELVARAVHYNSRRRVKPFVAVNCGAIVETLFESELFGHKKGSFTGAISDRDGLFRVAEGGTIFLDEISEIPLHLQVKLLRAIEQKEITPVGSSVSFGINVRIIAATNKNLRDEVDAGKFRDDLYYRLNVVEIHLPSLSDRPDDIPLLANHFLDECRQEMGRDVRGFTNQAMSLLTRHTWKGQVRELQNVIERAMIFCEGELIDVNDLPEYIQRLALPSDTLSVPSNLTLKEAAKNFERSYIMQILLRNQMDKERSAAELGISLSSLYRKMEELHIQPAT